jgi:arylsulfatase A-like enzyme
MDSRPIRTAALGGGLGVFVGLLAAGWQVVLPERYLELGLPWTASAVLVRWALGGLAIGLGAGLLVGLALRRRPGSGSRGGALAGLASMAVAVAGSALVSSLRPRADGPDLVLISIDTLRADRLGCYGYRAARTPNLDALARDGELWETVVASSPVTLPAMSTLMTGLDPPRHGAHYNGFYELRRDAVTLAELLRELGYATGAVVGNFALDRRFRIAQGFATYDDRMTRTMSRRRPRDAEHDGDDEESTWWHDHLASEPAQRFADEVTDAALDWLDTAGDEPFFLWVHYMDPHGPYLPPEGFRGGDPYDGEVAFVDAEVGRLLAGHAERFGERDTLFVVVAAHGESLGERGLTGHVVAVYEEACGTPSRCAGATCATRS